ncbi:MAG: Lar family restriction alleviation protein [Alphaproteobacteria bacterium]|nr:Lar family restriction alleviation protein [Alphaproteobacteria bacterium]
MNKMVDSDLKRCPFCGSNARVYAENKITFVVECNFCGAKVTGYSKYGKEYAIQRWNHCVKEVK